MSMFIFMPHKGRNNTVKAILNNACSKCPFSTIFYTF
jgi:hypothetical protein